MHADIEDIASGIPRREVYPYVGIVHRTVAIEAVYFMRKALTAGTLIEGLLIYFPGSAALGHIKARLRNAPMNGDDHLSVSQSACLSRNFLDMLLDHHNSL